MFNEREKERESDENKREIIASYIHDYDYRDDIKSEYFLFLSKNIWEGVIELSVHDKVW